jgi:hypothetical protein
MHVHANQFNANTQLDAIYAAARAEAKMAAERTRRKLLNAAAALAGEAVGESDCVVKLSGEDSPEGRENQQDSHGEAGETKPDAQAGSESSLFSDWA